jgi:hypothetical protein
MKPAPPETPAHARHGLRVGNLRCEITSTDDRYPPMLAAAYGTALLPDTEASAFAPDLRIAIRDDPRAAPTQHRDRLIVSRTSELVVLAADPMTWEVRASARPCLISVAIHDPALREDWLAYHFWILLNRALLLMGRMTLHAAALAYTGSVSLFAGPRGAGKSTIAVALAQAGAMLLADDHVVVRRVGDRLVVSGCNGRLRVTAKTEAHFLPGTLGPETLDVAGVPKKQFPADRFFAARPHEEHVVDRLFFPRVGPRFAIRPARRQAALLRLVEDTSRILRFHDRLTALADLVALVPCYDLELSPRLGDLDQLVHFLELPA